MNAVEKELITTAEFKPRKKYGNRQEYLRAVVNAVSKLDDDAFESLSDEAAEWCNAAIEVLNTTKNGDIPDFDEVEASEGDEPEDEADADEADADEDEADEPEDDDDEPEDDDDEPEDDEGENDDDETEEAADDDAAVDEPEEPKKPKLMGKGVKHEKSPTRPNVRSKEAKAKIAATNPKPKTPANMDVELDKWGCMVGSKNSQALAMFEKGATTAEVREKIGGTYYNILKKATEHGHRLEKEGAMIKLTHADDIGKAKPKAAAKAPAKKGKK